MSSSKSSFYPEIISSNPEPICTSSQSSASLYPSLYTKDWVVVAAAADVVSHLSNSNSQLHEEVLVTIPGAIVHLIERDYSVELTCGELTVVSLQQGDTAFAALARVGDHIQWPLAKDEASFKRDQFHYFFTLRVPRKQTGSDDDDDDKKGEIKSDEFELLNYGLTFASKGQEGFVGKYTQD